MINEELIAVELLEKMNRRNRAPKVWLMGFNTYTNLMAAGLLTHVRDGVELWGTPVKFEKDKQDFLQLLYQHKRHFVSMGRRTGKEFRLTPRKDRSV